MEYLKQIQATDNINNFTKFVITTDKRKIVILLPYTKIKIDDYKNKFVYKDSIINKINKLGIYTDDYLYKDWQQ